MEKISAVYKITNTVTNDFYIGSSKDVKKRWREHKCKYTWNRCPNNPMYQDMKRYGTDKFEFQVIEEVEESFLKEKEQQFIETLNPTYNQMNAKGLNIDKRKETNKEYRKTEKYKKYNKEYQSQLCFYNNEILTLNALRLRFRIQGISNPTQEAKKYLLN